MGWNGWQEGRRTRRCVSPFWDYASLVDSGNTGNGFIHFIYKLLAQIGQDLSSGTGTAIIAV